MSRIDILVEVALEEANSKPQDITKVLLVGGSTRIPAIQDRLEAKFGYAPEIAVNVDECVALGATIHAGLIKLRNAPDGVSDSVAAGLKDVKLTDVCNHSYGTICAPFDDELKKHIIANSIILKKNTPLPCEVKQTFYTMVDDQESLDIIITQGEDTDPDYVNKITSDSFELPKGRSANQPIDVCYSYDANQRMHCTFEDKNSGKVLNLEFGMEDDGNVNEENIESKTQQLEAFKVQ
jgi:molecular chaperone DnaK